MTLFPMQVALAKPEVRSGNCGGDLADAVTHDVVMGRSSGLP